MAKRNIQDYNPKRNNSDKREKLALQKALESKCNHNIKDLLSEQELEILNKLLEKRANH